MTAYISEIKRQFRDKYKFIPSGGTEVEPLFDTIPDGVYVMEIEGKMDYVEIRDGGIKCGNDEPPNMRIRQFESIEAPYEREIIRLQKVVEKKDKILNGIIDVIDNPDEDDVINLVRFTAWAIVAKKYK